MNNITFLHYFYYSCCLSENPCDSKGAAAWRSTNYALAKLIAGLKVIVENIKDFKALCKLIPCVPIPIVGGCTDVPKIACLAAPTVLERLAKFFVFAAETAFDISERIYGELCTSDGVDFARQQGRQEAIYENTITNHGNIIQTFYATQQLKVMLGDISEGLDGDREDRDDQGRRLLLENCIDTTAGYLSPPCAQSSCQDPTKLCDSSNNYPYIASLIQAGCNDLDSDGSGKDDDCEDRFPPNLVPRNAGAFRCDDDDTSRLCYVEEWFKNEKKVLNFLQFQFPAADDCAPSTKLGVNITYERGSCHDTVYTLTPFQDYPECNDRDPVGPFNIEFVNPLPGASREVTMQVDNVAPSVECGFLPNAKSINVIEDDKKTLFHYMTQTDGGIMHVSAFYSGDNGSIFLYLTPSCLSFSPSF